MTRLLLTTVAVLGFSYAAQAQITCSTLAGITTCTMPPPQPTYPPPVIAQPPAYGTGIAQGAYALESVERTRQMQAANPPPCYPLQRWLGVCK